MGVRKVDPMSFYSRVIYPRLCNLALDQPFVTRQRRELLADAWGEILEVGFGTGLNLSCYPACVRKITAVDPNLGMQRLAERRIKQTSIEVERYVVGGERLPFADTRFDCVVSTFTLCSIEHVSQALAEVYRVLKPGGRFLFLEHGLSPEPAVQRWQRRLNWLQTWLADGCRLDRNMRELVAGQPFGSVQCIEFYLEKSPKTHGYIYRGAAEK
jgi:ubiquinone/menaquinone biosynthesis C-methylase UbiE